MSSAIGAVLRDLAALGGPTATEHRGTFGQHVVLTPFGEAHRSLDIGQAVWLGLLEVDYRSGVPTYRVSTKGRTAHERGLAEQTSLLERVKRAHPIEVQP